ncbi:hypothetical protein [uncultured Stenotrophomonas sp.]|uniref:hypothetical protein n=1 Tax=uncultured Stenotrophomonas sp. TaxID=165438 RepID=UPI0025E0DE79|nr:hypothetical protein [uncultured Stenotrophomonas sp.]
MPAPAPTAMLCQLARQGWPLLVAALLTLWLGWSALQEGRGTAGTGTHAAWQAQLDEGAQAMPAPAPAGEGCPQHLAPAPETPFDGEASPACAGVSPVRPPLVAHVPLWPSDALRWQQPDPALRLNPGHAPPAPHAC